MMRVGQNWPANSRHDEFGARLSPTSGKEFDRLRSNNQTTGCVDERNNEQ